MPRPVGSKNKRTLYRERKIAKAAEVILDAIPNAFKGDSHALLMSVYKNPENELPLRIDAAKAAIRYEKPALNAVQHSGSIDLDVHAWLVEAEKQAKT